jgi:hypothetical protein
MGQFKPMVKMMTNEPSVILQLKKGGKVASQVEEMCHKPMDSSSFESESGKAPKKPSMMARVKAMNPNQHKKGGKIAKKGMGGALSRLVQSKMANRDPQASSPAPERPPAPTGVSVGPMQAMATKKPKLGGIGNAMQGLGQFARDNPNKLKGLGGMSLGTMGNQQGQTPMQAMSLGTLASMPDAERNVRAMQVRKALAGMKKGGSADSSAIKKLEKELHHHESMPMSKVHKKAMGGTIEGNAGQYAKTKMVTAHANRSKGSTGEVKEGKPGGYATGGAIPADSNKGGKNYAKTVMHTAKKDSAHGTGGVRMSNAGGFKMGGTIEGGCWENRPANTAKKGVTGTTTGEVKKGNGGGFKQGGMASKKAYATGGNVVDDGKAVKMPKHFVSQPVANSLQSGTFKRGGEVKHSAGGGRMPLKGHPYHEKSEDELRYIIKDANEAARAMKDHSPKSESKYLDQCLVLLFLKFQ